MTAMRQMGGHKVALLASLLWLSYSVVQCVGCPGSDSAFLRCRHAAGSEAVAAAPTAAAPHADCHQVPAEGEHSQPSCDDCCGSFANRTAVKENSVAKTVTAPIIAVLPALPAEIVVLGTRAFEQPSIVRAPRATPLFLLFRSLLL